MKKTIYHGSSIVVDKPLFGLGKIYNDYGLGFYCTEDIELAKEWAVSKNQNGFANIYEIDCTDLKILDLNDEKYCSLHWLALLLQNRTFDIPSPLALEAKEYIINNFFIPYEDYDIIIGYRADDSYFSFAQDFINGTISYRQLTNALYLGNLGQQFVLKSKIAFDRIHFITFEMAYYEQWYAKKRMRDINARRDYFNIEKNKRQKDDIYIMQIIDEEMKENDSRLR